MRHGGGERAGVGDKGNARSELLNQVSIFNMLDIDIDDGG
jgi:hypothetical protein